MVFLYPSHDPWNLLIDPHSISPRALLFRVLWLHVRGGIPPLEIYNINIRLLAPYMLRRIC